jgi:hypothetical protein
MNTIDHARLILARLQDYNAPTALVTDMEHAIARKMDLSAVEPRALAWLAATRKPIVDAATLAITVEAVGMAITSAEFTQSIFEQIPEQALRIWYPNHEAAKVFIADLVEHLRALQIKAIALKNA